MTKKNNRGPAPNQFTKYLLCAKAAGRCQFCNKYLFADSVTLEDNNDSNLAHIVASSPDGPRGDEIRSHELSDKIENLMLLCQEHHHLIDAHPEIYTEEALLDMKEAQEDKVALLCSSMNLELTEVLILQADIKGRQIAKIPLQQVVQAFIRNKKPFSTVGTRLEPSSIEDYHSATYWAQMSKSFEYQFNTKVKGILEFNPQICFSVFPLAPMPLIIKLGYLMGDTIWADIYQKTRTPDTWKWQATDVTNSFYVEKQIIRPGDKIAMVISLTADIAVERVSNVFDADMVYFIRAKRFGVDCIQSLNDLSEFWHGYQRVCDEIRNTHPGIQEVAVFPAMPVSAAFEVGRRYMPGVFPRLKIYDDDNGFFEALTIGG